MWLCGRECIQFVCFIFSVFCLSLPTFIILSLWFFSSLPGPPMSSFLKSPFFSPIPPHVAPVVAAGTPGVSGVSAWAQSEDDSGEATSPVPSWGLQWGGSPQGPQISIWASQGSGWEGRWKCWRSEHMSNESGLQKWTGAKRKKLNWTISIQTPSKIKISHTRLS